MRPAHAPRTMRTKDPWMWGLKHARVQDETDVNGATFSVPNYLPTETVQKPERVVHPRKLR